MLKFFIKIEYVVNKTLINSGEELNNNKIEREEAKIATLCPKNKPNELLKIAKVIGTFTISTKYEEVVISKIQSHECEDTKLC